MSPWASYQIRKIAGCACAGNAGNVFPRRRFQRKPIVSDPGMHHGTCVTHVPWCMSGSLTCVDGENVPGIPGACAPAILRIWQEAHALASEAWSFFMDSPLTLRASTHTVSHTHTRWHQTPHTHIYMNERKWKMQCALHQFKLIHMGDFIFRWMTRGASFSRLKIRWKRIGTKDIDELVQKKT